MDLSPPDTAYNIVLDEDGADGHAFGRPPGLRPTQWPCSRDNGLPMAHLFTVRVPVQYRCAGPELAGLSVFRDEAWNEYRSVPGVAAVIDGGDPPPHRPLEEPYWSALTAYARDRHPQERYETGSPLGEDWVWIWRTAAELAGPPCPLPDPAGRLLDFDGECPHAWRTDQPAQRLRLAARVDDPNVGKPYYSPRLSATAEEEAEGYRRSGYIAMDSDEGEDLGLDCFLKECHFGGTATPECGAGGDEFGPFFLAFEEWLGNPNLGGGFARIDLAAEEVGWSC